MKVKYLYYPSGHQPVCIYMHEIDTNNQTICIDKPEIFENQMKILASFNIEEETFPIDVTRNKSDLISLVKWQPPYIYRNNLTGHCLRLWHELNFAITQQFNIELIAYES